MRPMQQQQDCLKKKKKPELRLIKASWWHQVIALNRGEACRKITFVFARSKRIESLFDLKRNFVANLNKLLVQRNFSL